MAYSTIVKPADYFNTKLYTGNGGTNAQTGVGFQPDFTWIKARSNAENHNLFDAVRGVTKRIRSNGAEAEDTRTTSLTAFGTDGFTLGSGSQVNTNGWTFASWNWLANGAGSANTDGSINTTATSANTTSGFSIVQYTGTGSEATVGHGLGVKPKIIFFKNLSGSANWVAQSTLLGNKVQLVLNDTSAQNTDSRLGASDNWSSSVFTVGTYGDMNGSGNSYIAYCFAEKTGYSKISSYIGNGNSDGPFIYTGFKPAFILSKKTNAAGTQWTIWDNKRSSSGFNPADKILHPNVANPDNTADDTDFLSNGFKLRATASGMNNSGDTYIYMAFAEEPLVANSGTDGVPATAR